MASFLDKTGLQRFKDKLLEAVGKAYLGKTEKAASAKTADTATSATKATQDGAGNVITTTYATNEALQSIKDDILTALRQVNAS